MPGLAPADPVVSDTRYPKPVSDFTQEELPDAQHSYSPGHDRDRGRDRPPGGGSTDLVFAYQNAHAATPASANAHTCDGVKGFQHCQAFSFQWTFNTTEDATHSAGCCIQVQYTLSGHIGFDRSFKALPSDTTTWYHIRVLHAKLTAKVSVCGPGACVDGGAPRNLAMQVYWSSYRCSFDPNFSVGASVPWGIFVSVNPFPTCKGDRFAQMPKESPPPELGSRSSYTINSPQNVLAIDPVSTPKDKPGWQPCFAIFLYTGVWGASPGPAFQDYQSTVARKVCLAKRPGI